MKASPPVRRVVHVMRRFVPAKWGGTESVVYHVAREYERMGISSPIFATSMFANPGIEDFQGVTIRRFRYSLPWWGLTPEGRHALELKGGNPLSFSMLRALAGETQADFFHAHVQHRLGGSVRWAAKRHGKPYAVSIHGGHHTLPGEQTAQMLAPTIGKIEWGRAFGMFVGARRVLDDAAAIFCVGQDEADAMRAERPQQRVYYQPNGVDVQKFHLARAEDFLARHPGLKGKKLLLCVSRVDPQKNQILLVRALAGIRRTEPLAHVVLIGAEVAPQYAAELRKEISDRGMGEHVTWIPGLPPGDPALTGAYKAASCFVLPSAHEPFGIVILEAWAAGLPVVATSVGGIPGFTTNEKNLLLTPAGQSEPLAAAVQRILATTQLGETLANEGFRLACERYDWPAVAREMLAKYPTGVGEVGR
jgi:glycosyltransferase involved in cell wall biosynthesis